VLKRAHYWALGTVLVLTLGLLNLPPSAAGRLKLAVSGLFLPLFGLTGSGQSFVDRASYSALTRETLISEVERLRKETAQLGLAAAQARDTLGENARLRAMLGWQPKSPWKLRPAQVVGREPTTWWRSVTIDLGNRDGVRVNQPVLTGEGLVGRIRTVGPMHSQVALIGDPECGVFAVINETRDNGIIQEARSSMAGDGLVTLRTLQNSPKIMAGHKVLTSGLGGVFPRGVPVGDIVDSRAVDGGLYSEARVKLAANLNRLEEVWVITQ
jgi:rod shape-determining protein MreC